MGFYLPEDPRALGAQANLRFTAVNLTLDHCFEVDVNGRPVDAETLLYERRGAGRSGPSGAPLLPYGHIVGFPLAGTAALKGKNVLGVKLLEINPEIPKKDTIEIGRVEAVFDPT